MEVPAKPAPAGLPRPRWGFQTSLFQLREPAFWLFALLLLVTGVLELLYQAELAAAAPAEWALSWLLLGLYLLPMFVLIYTLDRFEREPLSLVFGAFLWGGVVATTLAGFANSSWASVVARLGGADFAARWAVALTAPVVEEVLKALGVVLIYLIARNEIDDVMDGFVYGAVVGLGFAVFENLYYFIGEAGVTADDVVQGFIVRVVLTGLYGHELYTGLTGMAIAYFVTRRGQVSWIRRVLVPGGLFLVAMFAHFLWNSPLLSFSAAGGLGFLLSIPVKGLPFLLFGVAMLALAHQRERRWLAVALEREVGGPGLRPDELPVLTSHRKQREELSALRRHGLHRQADLVKRLRREQINLAMIATRVADDDSPDLVRQRELCDSLRAALQSQIPSWHAWR